MNMKFEGFTARGFGFAAPGETPPQNVANLMQPGESIESISPEQLTPDLVRKLPLEFLKRQCAIPVTLEDGRLAVALAQH